MENEKLENLSSKVFRMEGLVDYQEGAIVSRTLIDRDSGTLTVFALDEGQTISEHTVPYDALVYILDGEAEITVSGEELRLKSGESTIMPADEPHSLKADERFKMVLVMIR